MQVDQNHSGRLGQRQLLQQLLLSGAKLPSEERDVSPQVHAIRAGRAASPQTYASDDVGPGGYADVALLGSPGLARGLDAGEAYADGKHMADHGHGGWGMIGANGSAMGGPGGLGGDTCLPWQGGGHQASPLEGSAQLLGPQVSFEERMQDTEVDAPMANLQLQRLQAGGEGLVGSWPGAAKHAGAVDAALPFFPGRPIRTNSSNLAAAGVTRTSSFNGPASARTAMSVGGHDGSFVADQLFGGCNSAPLTPRSPSYGFDEEHVAAAASMGMPGMPPGPAAGRGYARHGPSKLSNSSSDVAPPPGGLHIPASASLGPPAGLGGVAGMDAFGMPASCGTPDHLAASNLHMALQQQQAAMQMVAQQQQQQQPGLVGAPQQPCGVGGNPAAMAQALMAGMQDPAAGGPGSFGMMPPPNAMMPPDTGMNQQMQMLLYYAQLGMCTAMNGTSMGPPLPLPAGAPPVANMPMFPMLTPGQVAAAAQWQAGMGPAQLANIAAAAAVAATAVTSNEGEPGVPGRASSRPRGCALDKPERRLRLDKGGRGSAGRLDDMMGSPLASMRSDPLLEEYKNNRTRRWEMRDILGHMLEFSLDQLGSRFIQQKLDSLTPEELEAAFAEVSPKGLMLMNDVFGNYVIQKFLEMDVDAHRQELAAQMKGQVLSLSLQLYSCRVIQKALEVLPLEQKISMVSELDGSLMRCVRDQNGNHVIQKVIECVPTEHITSMLDTFSGNLVSLSQHPFGCRVMQRILEHCTDQGRYNAFMAEILKATVQLAQDQYGNYVIQHVVEQGRPHERDAVYERLFPHIVVLSQNKFASNVVEKMLLHCSAAQRASIVEEFLAQPRPSGDGGGGGGGEQQSALEQMMQDQYGNYVVQKTLEVCDEGQRERLLSRVRCYYEILKTSTFGKHIVNRLEKLLSAGMRIQVNSLPLQAPAAAAPAAAAAASAAPPAGAAQQQAAAASAGSIAAAGAAAH